jgi:hypothetical protein
MSQQLLGSSGQGKPSKLKAQHVQKSCGGKIKAFPEWAQLICGLHREQAGWVTCTKVRDLGASSPGGSGGGEEAQEFQSH